MVEELTDTQLKLLQRQLQERRDELQEQLADLELEAEGGPQEQARTDTVARLNEVQEQAMLQANRQHAQVELSQVVAALQAMDAGEYGLCQRCEEAIPFQRLQIMPASQFCVNCQAQREMR